MVMLHRILMSILLGVRSLQKQEPQFISVCNKLRCPHFLPPEYFSKIFYKKSSQNSFLIHLRQQEKVLGRQITSLAGDFILINK